MKVEFESIPQTMKEMDLYGFSWMEYITAIPSPLFLVTTYKANGLPNACLQSWATFSGNPQGAYVVLANVNKHGHFYQTILETQVAVLNFPTEAIFDACYATIANNDYSKDEIRASGLTPVQASRTKAPMIEECFMNLECRFLWQKDIKEGDENTLMCFEILYIHMDPKHLDENGLGRYGSSGLLYNIHNPINPITYQGRSQDFLGTINKQKALGTY